MPVKMKKVFSSHISEVGYDPDAQELNVTFQNGKTAVYMGVPSDTAQLVVDAPSVGTALNQFIKNKFAYGYRT